MSLASEHHLHAFDDLLGIHARRGVVGIEDDGHLGACNHPVDGQTLDELVTRRFERNVEQPLEGYPRMNHVVTVDDDAFHQRSRGIWAWPMAIRPGSIPTAPETCPTTLKNACDTEGTNHSTMNTMKIADWPNWFARSCAAYGSHGRMMPKPSSPGIGSMFNTIANASMNPRNASAAKKLRWELIQSRWPGTRNGIAISRPHTAVPAGPAIETAESHTLLRSAERLM